MNATIILLLIYSTIQSVELTQIPYFTTDDQSSFAKVFFMPLEDSQVPKNLEKDWSTVSAPIGIDAYKKSLNDQDCGFAVTNKGDKDILVKIRVDATTHPREVALLIRVKAHATIIGRAEFPKIEDNRYDLEVFIMKEYDN